MGKLYEDEDGIDGPFDLAMRRTEREDERKRAAFAAASRARAALRTDDAVDARKDEGLHDLGGEA